MAQALFWLKQRANGRWRRFVKKPTRRVRRFIKRRPSGKGKGRGGKRQLTGRGINAYLAALAQEANEGLFFGGRGKGKGRRKGRRSTGAGK